MFVMREIKNVHGRSTIFTSFMFLLSGSGVIFSQAVFAF